MDYPRLLARAGLVLRKRAPGVAWLGDANLSPSSAGARVTAAVPFDSPLYKAGIDQGDLLVSLDETTPSSPERLEAFLKNRRPGDRVTVTFTRRGVRMTTALVLEEDPRLELRPVETIGGTLTPNQRAFREAWLGSKVR